MGRIYETTVQLATLNIKKKDPIVCVGIMYDIVVV